MSANYTELLAEVESWSNRADLTAKMADFILYGEKRLNRDLRIRQMEASSDLSAVAGTREIALPSDYLEVRRVYIDGSPVSELGYVGPHVFWGTHGSSEPGKPKFYTVEGNNLVLGAIPDSAYTVKFTYYQQIPPLVTNATNWLLEDAPDLYVYASLIALAHYARDNEYLATVTTLYTEAMKAMRKDGRYGGNISYQPKITP